MASTFSTNLALELIGTGDQAGTWGITTNTNLGTLIEQAISGYVTQAVATGTDTTITIPDGATGVARNMYIELTGTGGTNTNLIVPSNKKLYFIFNNSTGAVTVKVTGQTGVSVPAGKKMVLVSNGTDIVNAANYVADFGSNSATITQLTSTSATITNLTLTSLVLSNLSIASANVTTLTSASATITNLLATTLTISGGTANGVLYLNASKLATSGSALTFDGTNLTTTGRLNTGANLGLLLNNATGAYALWQYNGTNVGEIGTANQLIGGGGTDDFAINTRQAAGDILFAINTSEQMRLTSTGLGIGTSSPAYPLQVRRAGGAGSLGISIDGVASTDRTVQYFAIQDSASGNGTGHAFYYRAPSSTTDTLGFMLDESGNFGIGTSSPGTYGKLAIISTGTSTTTAFVNGSAANASNTVSTDYWSGNSFGGLEKIATIGAINPNAGANNGGALYFSTSSNGTATTPTERMRLDSSGNLGLGVTPSAWAAAYKALQITPRAALSSNTSGDTLLTANAFNGSGGWTYIATAAAAAYAQSAGSHVWYNAASGTAGNAITFTQAMTLDASGNLGVGTTSPSNRLTVSGANTAARGQLSVVGASASPRITLYEDSTFYAAFAASGTDAYIGTESNTPFRFITNGSERARITSGGTLIVGKTTDADAGAGVRLLADGLVQATRNAADPLSINRTSDDGVLVSLRQDGVLEGNISVSGNTVSYNSFAGSHWSQLQDGSKPDILRGTVMESINELCVWPGEQNERLPKAKISDTAGSKKVYGVFMAWDNDWTETNDMYVTAVGAFICRVNGNVTVQEGDLLESNGDGTARVQADDIIRSSTIGKVTSTVKTHEYDDGSYCVPTVLYCG